MIFLFLFTSLSVVSADDVNETDTVDNALSYSIYENNILEDNAEIYVGDLNGSYVPDGSYSAPFHNLKDAITYADNNSTIILMDGIYKGSDNLDITINKNITVKSLNGNSTIDGEGKYVFFTNTTYYSDTYDVNVLDTCKSIW